MKLFIINGPNLNMLGIREPEIYGNRTYASLTKEIEAYATECGCEAVCYQSNHEGELVDCIQRAYFEGAQGIVINPGAYTLLRCISWRRNKQERAEASERHNKQREVLHNVPYRRMREGVCRRNPSNQTSIQIPSWGR